MSRTPDIIGFWTLEHLAEDLRTSMRLMDDISSEEMEHLEDAQPEEVVRHYYLQGECDAFAAALHHVTGWPVRSLTSRRHGPVHRFVEAPDGRWLDASGWTDLHTMRKLWSMPVRDAIVSAPLSSGTPSGMAAWELMESDNDGFAEVFARAVVAMRRLPGDPFQSEYFARRVAAPLEGVDYPLRDPDEPAPPV